MKFLRILFLFSFLFSTNVFAQDVGSIIKAITMGEGPLTKQEYDAFWAGLSATDAVARSQVIRVLKGKLVLTQEYQREIWICAEQAWNRRSVPRCEKARNKFSYLRTEMMKEGKSAISSIKPMEEYSDSILKAAATRGTIKNETTGEDVPLTLEKIKNTRDGLDKMLSRFSQVLRPNF